MKVNKMNSAAEEVCDVMGLLSNKSRLMLLCQLIGKEKSFGELVANLGAREPAVSQQLAVLRRQGLVQNRREGKAVFYKIADPKVSTILETLYDLYCECDIETKAA